MNPIVAVADALVLGGCWVRLGLAGATVSFVTTAVEEVRPPSGAFRQTLRVFAPSSNEATGITSETAAGAVYAPLASSAPEAQSAASRRTS